MDCYQKMIKETIQRMDGEKEYTASIFGSELKLRGVLGFWLQVKPHPRIQSEATVGAKNRPGINHWVPFALRALSEDSSDVCLQAKYAGSGAIYGYDVSFTGTQKIEQKRKTLNTSGR